MKARPDGMKVLVVGGGGREHALAWALSRSPSVGEVWTAPGNPGTASLGPRAAVAADDVSRLSDLAEGEGFDLVVVGPEAPLVAGITDRLRERGIACFGPSAAAARVEASKAFAKTTMARLGIPTAPFSVAASVEEALSAVRALGLPVVLKADGLAAGKGVRIASSLEEARRFAWEAMEEGCFGEAGRRLVVEAFLEGREVSLFVVTDGESFHPLLPARDYKRLGTGDVGPNTGGMGAYAPAALDASAQEEILDLVVEPLLTGLRKEGTSYTGLLYCGIMRTPDGPSVLEFNCRFGDPETQALVPLLAGDLGELLRDSAEGSLGEPPAWSEESCVAVVLAARGYPEAPTLGDPVRGIADAEAAGALVFQAGTREEKGALVSAGGRVLAVSGLGADQASARAAAYRGLARIELAGGQWREDVGLEGETTSLRERANSSMTGEGRS